VHKTICPHCDKPSYSSTTLTQVCECPYCGKHFLAVEGEELGRFVEKAAPSKGSVPERA